MQPRSAMLNLALMGAVLLRAAQGLACLHGSALKVGGGEAAAEGLVSSMRGPLKAVLNVCVSSRAPTKHQPHTSPSCLVIPEMDLNSSHVDKPEMT